MSRATLETDLRILLHMRHTRDTAMRIAVRAMIARDIAVLRRSAKSH